MVSVWGTRVCKGPLMLSLSQHFGATVAPAPFDKLRVSGPLVFAAGTGNQSERTSNSATPIQVG